MIGLVESSVGECAQPSVLRRIDLWAAKGPSIYPPSWYDVTYWVVGQSLGFPQPHLSHIGFLPFILDRPDYVAMTDNEILLVGPKYCPQTWMTHPHG